MKKDKDIRCSLKWLGFTLLAGTIICSINSCQKNSDTTVPEATIQALYTNGTIIPISKNIIKGTLFAIDETGKSIPGLTTGNVSAKLKWVHLKSVQSDSSSVAGLVVVTANLQTGIKVAAGITMDYSGSMYGLPTVIPSMEKGVKTFIRSMAATDLGEIIKFSDDVFIAQAFTSDTTALIAGVDNNSFNLNGSTALYQSIFTGLQEASLIDSSQYLRAVIGFTDGGENASSVSESEMIEYALSHGIPISTIGFLGTTTVDSSDLRYIAQSTGGFFFLAENDSTFAKIYATISGQLKNSYSYTANWQGTLPPSGTQVTAIITTTYQNHTSSFQRTFILP